LFCHFYYFLQITNRIKTLSEDFGFKTLKIASGHGSASGGERAILASKIFLAGENFTISKPISE